MGRIRSIFIAGVGAGALVGIGLTGFTVYENRRAEPMADIALPLDALSPEQRRLYYMVASSVMSPVEEWLAVHPAPGPGEVAEPKKRLMTEFEARARVRKLPVEGLERRLKEMGDKVRAIPNVAEDMARIGALAAFDFEAITEPKEGAAGAWRSWLVLAKLRYLAWRMADAQKAYLAAIPLLPADYRRAWRWHLTVVISRTFANQRLFAEQEAFLRENGPKPGGAQWPSADEGWFLCEVTTSLMGQGKFTDAEPLARRSLEVSEKAFGLVNANVAIQAATLGSILFAQRKFAESAKHFARASAAADKTMAPGDIRPYSWDVYHGRALIEIGKADESRELFQNAMDRAQKRLTPGSFMVSELQRGLADAMRALGGNVAADRLESEAMEDMESMLNEKDPAKSAFLSVRAAQLKQRGDTAGAERIYLQAIKLAHESGNMRDLGKAAAELAFIYNEQLRIPDAKRLVEPVVAQVEKSSGEAASELVFLLEVLAITRLHEGKIPLGRLLLQRALAIAEKNHGESGTVTLHLLVTFAGFESLAGNYAEEERLLRKGLATYEHIGGRTSPDAIELAFRLAESISQQDRKDDALALYERSLADAQAALPPNDARLVRYLDMVARMYQGMRRHADAKELARRALAIAVSIHGEKHPVTAGAAATLATSLFAHGEDAEAEKLLSFALSTISESKMMLHPDLIPTLEGLARIRVSKGDYANAEALLRIILKVMEERVRPDDVRLAKPLAWLGETIGVRGRPGEGEGFLRRSLILLSRDYVKGAPLPKSIGEVRMMYERILRAMGMKEPEIESRIEATVPAKPRSPTAKIPGG